MDCPGPSSSSLPSTSSSTLDRDARPAARDRLIHTALDLFYRQGFHATGMEQILAKAQVARQTFYNHFESKEALALVAVELRCKRETEAIVRQVMEIAGDNPRRRILTVFDVIHDWFTHRGYNGCSFIPACAEFPSDRDPIHQAGARHWAQVRELFVDWAGLAGCVKPEVLADEIITLIQGVFTRRLIDKSSDTTSIARRMAERAIDTCQTA